MLHTRTVYISSHNKILSEYFDGQTHAAKNLKNKSNFIIRNLRTGLAKAPDERTENEKEVITLVFDGIDKYNVNLHKRISRGIVKIGKLSCSAMAKSSMVYELYKKKEFEYPDKNHWMLSYEVLDAVMKHTRQKEYYDIPSQSNQQVLRKVIRNWKGYFGSCKSYRENPGSFTGAPKPPGYTKSSHSTAIYTNQIIKTYTSKSRLYLLFPGCKLAVCVGTETSKLVKVEVKPHMGGYKVCVTFENDIKAPKIPKIPAKILGIDPGIDNFMTCVANFQLEPFIIDGKWIKSANQGFNKSRSRLMSELTAGLDSTKSQKTSKRLDAISRKRDDQFHDFFYKAAHYIVNRCLENSVDVIIVGHNKFQKQDISIGSKENQSFVSIPYLKFFGILEWVSTKAGIPVIVTEESYTSKASLIDRDTIPIYGQSDDEAKFSGRRISRGQYKTKESVILNADVNGAGNIIRKVYPEAFKDVKDYSYLFKTVIRVKRKQLCQVVHTEKSQKPKRLGMRPYLHHEHMVKKQEYMKLFNVSSSNNVVSYTECSNKNAAKAA